MFAKTAQAASVTFTATITDNDPEDTNTVDWELATSNTFTTLTDSVTDEAVTMASGSGTWTKTITLSPTSTTTYYWHIRSQDGHLAQSAWSATRSFSVTGSGGGGGGGTTPSASPTSGSSGTTGTESSTTTDTTAPANPSNVSVTAGDTKLYLSWADPADSDLDKIYIYRSTENKKGDKIATIDKGTLSYTDTGLTNGTTYYYVLSATDSSGNESDGTNPVSGKPERVSNVEPIKNLRTYIGAGSISLTYDPIPADHLVFIYRSTKSNEQGSEIARTSQNWYTDSSVETGINYYYSLIVKRNSDQKVSVPVTTSGIISNRYNLSIFITYGSISVRPDEKRQLTAKVYNEKGELINLPITWELINPKSGTVTPGGLLTGGEVGDYLNGLKASVKQGDKTGESSVDLYVDSDNFIGSLHIDPSSVTLKPGQEKQFRAYAYNQNHSLFDPTKEGYSLSWEAEGGTITQSGKYKAESTEKTFERGVTVRAIKDGVTYLAYATVTVSSEPLRLDMLTMTQGRQAEPNQSTAPYYSFGYDQFNNYLPAASAPLYSNSNQEAGIIDSVGIFHADDKEGCYGYINRSERSYKGVTLYNRGFLNVIKRTPEEIERINTTTNLAFIGSALFTHKINTEFGYRAAAYNGWGIVRPHTLVKFKILDSRAGTITPEGLFKAGETPGLYLNTLEVTAFDIQKQETIKKLTYPIFIAGAEEEHPVFATTKYWSRLINTNDANYTYGRIYNQYSIQFGGWFVPRYRLDNGADKAANILPAGLIETFSKVGQWNQSLYSTIKTNFGTLETDNANKGYLIVREKVPNTSCTTNNKVTIDGPEGPPLPIDPKDVILPGSLAAKISNLLPDSSLKLPSFLQNILQNRFSKIAQNLSQALAVLTGLGLLASLPTNLITTWLPRRRKHIWGIVEDGDKMPVDKTLVRLIFTQTNKTVDQMITGNDGNYNFLVPKIGTYRIAASKVNYQGFISIPFIINDINQPPTDLNITLLEDNQKTLIPKQSILGQTVLNLLAAIHRPLLILGTLATFYNAIIAPGTWVTNIGIALYAIFWLIEIYQSRLPKPFGTVIDSTTQTPLEQVIVKLFKVDSDKKTLVATTVTDRLGRFKFIATNGYYQIQAIKFNYQNNLTKILNFKKGQIVSTDIKLIKNSLVN